MSSPNPNPLDYASPENRGPPTFAVHPGGWLALVLFILLTVVAAVVNWLHESAAERPVPADPVQVIPYYP